MTLHVDAKEAMRLLGVRPQTLYAYVSRGLIRADREAGQPSRYRLEDVEKLSRRKRRGRSAAAVAGQALDFGAPVLESGITEIRDGEILLRGRPLMGMAMTATLEEVAAHLWGADPGVLDDPANLPPRVPYPKGADQPVARAMAVLPVADARDRTALTLDARERHRVAARVYRLSLAALAGVPVSADPAHKVLADAWRCKGDRAGEGIRLGLVLSADHELNASTFAVRVVASTGASLYMALCGGFGAITGPLHGGMSERAWAMVDQLLLDPDVEGACVARHASGAPFYGFGHPLYPDRDPRAGLLLDWLGDSFARAAEFRTLSTLMATAEALTGRKANIDFALVVMCRLLGLPRQAPLTLFAGGRTAGWIAHALEQGAARTLIRPRARYVGPPREVGA